VDAQGAKSCASRRSVLESVMRSLGPQDDLSMGGMLNSPPQYSLRPHVFCCRVNSGIILLDLKQDKYLSLADADIRPISRFVSDFSSLGCASAEFEPATSADVELLETLERRRILTPGTALSERLKLPIIQQTGLLTDLCENTESRVSLRGHHLINFVAAFVTTLWALRWHSLEFAIQRIVRRKRSAGDALFDLERATEATAAFRRIRPYFFTAYDRCLFHALLLTEYLAHYRIFPIFIIGVKVTPWAAHAWVQHENHVLDMSPDRTFSFTPIFAI
jgi:hypothetical protein